MSTDVPGEGSQAVPRRGESADTPGVGGGGPARTIRLRVHSASAQGDDPVAVVSGHPGINAAHLEGDVLVAEVTAPADHAALAGLLADHGFDVADA